MEEIDKFLDKVLLEKKFPQDKIISIKTELARRNVSRSFRRMPINLICSIYRKEIEHIRDFGDISISSI